MAKNQLGAFMKKRRSELGITQADLAGRLGVAQGYISMIERGKKAWPETYIEALAKELEVLPSDLAHAAGRDRPYEETRVMMGRARELGEYVRRNDPDLQRHIDGFPQLSEEEKLRNMTVFMDSLVGMGQMLLGTRATLDSIISRLKEMSAIEDIPENKEE